MNKQAFTFLTLFTLVLMLSIYYITLPTETKNLDGSDLIAHVEQDVFEQYQKEKESQDAESRSYNEQVISSSTSTSEEKLEALNQNSVMDQEANTEHQIEQILKELGYESCFVEINKEIVRVVLPKEFDSQINALNVIQKVSQICEQQVLIEVSFE